jgi:hypothetical protein
VRRERGNGERKLRSSQALRLEGGSRLRRLLAHHLSEVQGRPADRGLALRAEPKASPLGAQTPGASRRRPNRAGGLGLLGWGGFAGLAFGPSLRAVFGLEAHQLVSVDQPESAGWDRGNRALPNESPEDDAGHPDFVCGLWDRQQPSFLHVRKGKQTVNACNRIPRLLVSCPHGILATNVSEKGVSTLTQRDVQPRASALFD